MKICTIIGARPQFIKAAPVSRAIAEHNRLAEVIIHTGQHFDADMSDVFFKELNIPEPHYNLGINSASHGAMTGRMLEKIEEILIKEKPDWVLVCGDTNSTLAGALAASKLHIPIAHVEAGLRSFNREMPEEHNRVLTDHCADILFCPTERAVENLRNEGFTNIVTNPSPLIPNPYSLPLVTNVGDVMLDAALYYKQYAKKPQFDLPEQFILATIHRAENTEEPERLKSIFRAFDKICQEIPIILPLHPRTRKIIQDLKLKTSNFKLQIVEPVSYLEMVYLLERCILVMTDSGGLQKESYFFGKPCVTLRDETEWVETVEAGWNVVVGADHEKIVSAAGFFKHPDHRPDLHGDGQAAERIVRELARHMR